MDVLDADQTCVLSRIEASTVSEECGWWTSELGW